MLHDGDENVRESIVEQSESPRENLINKMQSSANRFSNELQADNILLPEQILSQSESFISLSSQHEHQQYPKDQRSLQ